MLVEADVERRLRRFGVELCLGVGDFRTRVKSGGFGLEKNPELRPLRPHSPSSRGEFPPVLHSLYKLYIRA